MTRTFRSLTKLPIRAGAPAWKPWLALAVLCSALCAAHAGDIKPYAIEDLFKNSRYGQTGLSPDTRHLAAIAEISGRMRLVVMDLASREMKAVAGFSDSDIAWFAWINDRRLVFNLMDRNAVLGEQQGAGLFAVDADGSDLRELMPPVRKQARSAALVRVVHGAIYLHRIRNSDDILILKTTSGKRGAHVMRQDTHTGRMTSEVMGISGDIVNALADSNGTLRALQSVDNGGRLLNWYRSDSSADWRQIAAFSSAQAIDLWTPLGFSVDGKSLWVSARVDRDKAAIYSYDLASRRIGELAVAHPDADITGGLHLAPQNGELLGVTIEADKPHTWWFDAAWAKAQATVDAALPGRVNRLSGDVASRVLVYSYSERDPGRYYLYDMSQGNLVELFATRPDLDPARLARTRFLTYAARDQRAIPAYLTLPLAAGERKPPLVVLVHGGPAMRDHWSFNPTVQFLAGRGYAVLQPQFRGSVGFGAEHFRAGWKAWGLSMQDDLSDGVRAMIEQGHVDSSRVCIMGTSYGGYAAMMGLAKDPGLYRCGVSFAGVSDLGLLFSVGWSDYANSLWADFGMKQQIGDPVIDAAQFALTSPVEQAAKIAAPLFLAYATDDYRVPMVHGEKMRAALDGAKKPYEWFVLTGEGHGMMLVDSRVAYFRRVEAFLATHLAATPQAAATNR